MDSCRSMFYSYEFNAARAAGIGEDVDRNANDWAAFEARLATEHLRPSSVRTNASRNGVLASPAIETYFHFPVGTLVADAGVRKKRPFVGIASHRDSRGINAIFDHVAGHPTGARR